jgi:DNA sulfur modification protein DndC
VTPEVFRQVNELKSRGALFIVNHSGGKDSQAMLITLRRFVPAEQLILVHADLGEVEWAGLKEHIKATAPDLPLEVALAIYKDGSEKTLLGEWERKGKAPSPAQRWCTSDLKRGPIEKIVRRVMKERGIQVAVNCMGMRAGESCDRAKLEPWKLNKRLSLAGREVWDWLPIHGLTTEEVFQTIAQAGQKPHPAYGLGLTRLSCSFCIMGSKGDLTRAAELRPELYRRYVELEKKTGFTLQSGKTLEETTGIQVKLAS